MTGVPSQASTGTFQVDKVPSQADKGPSHVDKEHSSITLCRSALSGRQVALSGHHEAFPNRQNNLLGLLKTIQDPHRLQGALAAHALPHQRIALLGERGTT